MYAVIILKKCCLMGRPNPRWTPNLKDLKFYECCTYSPVTHVVLKTLKSCSKILQIRSFDDETMMDWNLTKGPISTNDQSQVAGQRRRSCNKVLPCRSCNNSSTAITDTFKVISPLSTWKGWKTKNMSLVVALFVIVDIFCFISTGIKLNCTLLYY